MEAVAVIVEALGYLWAFFSGLTTGFQVVLHPDFIVRTWKDVVEIFRRERK